MNCQLTLSLGVYVLGAADARERMRIEAHLPGCSACREELTRLAPVPELLARLPQDMVPDCVPADPAKIRQRPQIRLRQAPARAWRWPATAAAALLLGMAGGLWLGHGGTGQRQAAPAASFSGVNPAAGISATAALHATSWGTSIGLRLDGVPRNVECRLVVHSRGGGTEITGAWSAWSPGAVSVPASAAWRPADITSLQVTVGKRTLVTLTAVRSGANAGTLPPGGG